MSSFFSGVSSLSVLVQGLRQVQFILPHIHIEFLLLLAF